MSLRIEVVAAYKKPIHIKLWRVEAHNGNGRWRRVMDAKGSEIFDHRSDALALLGTAVAENLTTRIIEIKISEEEEAV